MFSHARSHIYSYIAYIQECLQLVVYIVYIGVYPAYPEVLYISLWPNKTVYRVGESVSILCQFKAPVMGTVVQWLKNGSPISTINHYKTEQGDEFASNLTITDFIQDGQANFSCYCFYNRSIVISQRPIVSNTMFALVHAIEGICIAV